ncbi:MAG TPA: TPM domain-containing protein [Abditibacteriaceae bacterium]|jgi:uncharacterized protein
MKKNLAVILFCALLFGVLPSGAETVQSIPNPLRTNRSWVSDNANVIDAVHETQINRAIESFKNQTSGEIAVVTVQNTGGEVAKEFATELFNHWGIGKRGKDNGVLVLLVMENRRLAVETGYGVEGELPDGKAMALAREIAVPQFKQGNFGGGLLALTREYIQVLGGTLPATNNSQGNPATSNPEPVHRSAPQTAPQYSPPISNQPEFDRPYNSRSPRDSSPFDLVLGLFMLAMVPLGIGILGWGGFAVLKQLASRKCSKCGREMRRLDEQAEDKFLSSDQQFEERLGGLDYKVWECNGCGVCHIERSARWMSNVKECPRCHHYTLKVTSETVRQATYHSNGLRETTRSCEYPSCGHHEQTTETLPRLQREVIIVSGGSHHYGSSSDSSWGGSWGSGSSSSSSSSSDSGFSSSSSDFGGGSSGGGGGETGW